MGSDHLLGRVGWEVKGHGMGLHSGKPLTQYSYQTSMLVVSGIGLRWVTIVLRTVSRTINPLSTNDAHVRHGLDLHKPIGTHKGDLTLGVMFGVSASFSCFLWSVKG